MALPWKDKKHKIQMPVCPYCKAVAKHYGWRCPKNPKNKCKNCDTFAHSSLMCLNKPRRPLNQEAAKTKSKRIATRQKWLKENPCNENGLWFCYLRISPNCPYQLTRTTLRLEHVKSKVRYPELKYEISNLRSSCEPCNKIKGSLDLEELSQLSTIRLPKDTTWADVYEAAGVQ